MAAEIGLAGELTRVIFGFKRLGAKSGARRSFGRSTQNKDLPLH
jgi:hypothetical protein